MHVWVEIYKSDKTEAKKAIVKQVSYPSRRRKKKKSLLTNLTTKKDLFSIGNVLMNIFKSQSYTLQLPLCTDHHQKREKKIINNIIQENKPKQAYLHALAQLLTQPAASPL